MAGGRLRVGYTFALKLMEGNEGDAAWPLPVHYDQEHYHYGQTQ